MLRFIVVSPLLSGEWGIVPRPHLDRIA